MNEIRAQIKSLEKQIQQAREQERRNNSNRGGGGGGGGGGGAFGGGSYQSYDSSYGASHHGGRSGDIIIRFTGAAVVAITTIPLEVAQQASHPDNILIKEA
jgi:hypothetical protein